MEGGGALVAEDLAVVAVRDGAAFMHHLDGAELAGPIDLTVDLRVDSGARAPLEAASVQGVAKVARLAAIGNVTTISDFGSRALPYRAWVTDLARAVPMVSICRPPAVRTLGEVVALVRSYDEPHAGR